MSKVLTPILFIIAAIGLYFSYISGALDTLNSAQKLSEQLGVAIEQYDRLFERRDELRERYMSVSLKDEASLMQLVPDDIDPVRIIIDIDQMANEAGVLVNTFRLPVEKRNVGTDSNQSGGNILGTAFMQVMVEGDYATFKEFLKLLENSRTMFDVVGLDIQKKDLILGSEAVQQYTVALHVYWLKK